MLGLGLGAAVRLRGTLAAGSAPSTAAPRSTTRGWAVAMPRPSPDLGWLIRGTPPVAYVGPTRRGPSRSLRRKDLRAAVLGHQVAPEQGPVAVAYVKLKRVVARFGEKNRCLRY